MYPEYPQPQHQKDLVTLIKENKLQAGIIGGGGLFLLVAMVAIIGLFFGGETPLPSKMAATSQHMTLLSEFTDQQHDELISEPILRQNAVNGVMLATAANDINTAITNVYGAAEPSEEVAAVSAGRLAAIEAAMQTSVAANTYDATYKKEMLAELRIINARLASYTEEAPPSVDAVLIDTIKRLTETRKRLEAVEI